MVGGVGGRSEGMELTADALGPTAIPSLTQENTESL